MLEIVLLVAVVLWLPWWLKGMLAPRVWVRPDLSELIRALAPAMHSLVQETHRPPPPKPLLPRWRLKWEKEHSRLAVRVDYAKDLIRYVAGCFGMNAPRIAVRFRRAEGPAGSIHFSGGTWYVNIDNRYRDDDEQLAAIIAHEFAHVFLADRRIRLHPTRRNEELTDAATTFAGFGKLLQGAYYRETQSWAIVATITRISKLGYLAVEDIALLDRIRTRICTGAPLRIRTPICTKTGELYHCVACAAPQLLPNVDATIRLRCRGCKFPVQLSLCTRPIELTFLNRLNSLAARVSDSFQMV